MTLCREYSEKETCSFEKYVLDAGRNMFSND
jgi:hypothetical protein